MRVQQGDIASNTVHLELGTTTRLVDNTKATSTIKPGINESLSEEVGVISTPLTPPFSL